MTQIIIPEDLEEMIRQIIVYEDLNEEEILERAREWLHIDPPDYDNHVPQKDNEEESWKIEIPM